MSAVESMTYVFLSIVQKRAVNFELNSDDFRAGQHQAVDIVQG
jgi:hypothetical protein